MVAAPWVLKMGNQVTQNLKNSSLLDNNSSSKKNPRKKLDQKEKEIIGILSFEVANVISKTIHLHNSLTDLEVYKLKNEVVKSEGVKKLVSCDESYLLELVLAEKLEELDRVCSVVSRLGKKCNQPALHGFEHVYGDLTNGVIDVKQLGFLVKDMEGMVRKMDRYVTATSSLYCEMEALNELEQAVKRFQVTQNEDVRRSFEQKLNWQRQDVSRLKDTSLWNQSYDKVVELLVRTVCTIYRQICLVFGEPTLRRVSPGDFDGGSLIKKVESTQVASQIISGPLRQDCSRNNAYNSGPFQRAPSDKKGTTMKLQDNRRAEVQFSRPEDFVFPCVTSPGRLFMDCLSLSSSASELNDEDITGKDDRSSQISGYYSNALNQEQSDHSICFSRSLDGFPLSRKRSQSQQGLTSCGSQFGSRNRFSAFAHPCTVGGSALALHYSNIIIIIEKLLRYPHLVGDEARDDLYQMLPTSLRMSLKINLKSYVKCLAIYDAPLAHGWKETLDKVLRWLTPMAHNMIRWQSERNFEQHQIGSRTNVLLLQTLYFCDREKTEAAICELLVGLNYICRYEHQQNALLDCASSFDYDDFKEWQLQSSFLH